MFTANWKGEREAQFVKCLILVSNTQYHLQLCSVFYCTTACEDNKYCLYQRSRRHAPPSCNKSLQPTSVKYFWQPVKYFWQPDMLWIPTKGRILHCAVCLSVCYNLHATLRMVCIQVTSYLASFPWNRRRLWRRLSCFIQMKLLRYAVVLKIRILVKVLDTTVNKMLHHYINGLVTYPALYATTADTYAKDLHLISQCINNEPGESKTSLKNPILGIMPVQMAFLPK